MNSMILSENESKSTFSAESLIEMASIDNEQLAFVRRGIQFIDELEVAQKVHYQILKTIQAWSDVLLDVEMKFGDMLKKLPKCRGRVRKDRAIQVICEFETERPKGEIIEELGLKKNQARRFEMLSENKELIAQLRSEASEYNQFPTIQRILRCIREQKELRNQQETQEQPDDLVDEKTQRQMLIRSGAYKKLNNILLDLECLIADDEYFNALANWYADAPSMIDTDHKRLTQAFAKLRKFEDFFVILNKSNNKTDVNNKSDNDPPSGIIRLAKNRIIKNFIKLFFCHKHDPSNYS